MSGVLHGVLASIAGGARGEQVYDIPGTYTWTVPAGVTSICVVCVGGGAGTAANVDGIGTAYYGGGGGGLTYKNNISVTPGDSYTVIVGSGNGAGGAGGNSSMSGTSISMTAGGGQVGTRSAASSGGDVNNYGSVPTYTTTSGSLLFMGNGEGPSYTYNETNTSPFAQIGGSAGPGLVTVSGITYTAYQGSVINGVTLDNSGAGFVGMGGKIIVSGGVLSSLASYAGGVRIIWGAGRSYPNNAT